MSRETIARGDLIERVCVATGYPKGQVENTLAQALEQIAAALAGGETVRLTGFGTFETAAKPARKGTGPDGRPYRSAAGVRVKFSAGRALKDRLKAP